MPVPLARHLAGISMLSLTRLINGCDWRPAPNHCRRPSHTATSRHHGWTVKVSCANPQPWKIYVPVRRAIYRQILLATRPLARGSILTPDDIILAESDTSLLSRGYVVASQQAVGHKIRRTIMAGDPITPGLLETPAMIRRGQKISLQARSGALTVRMAGIARSDGMLGQVIEFENLSSKRSIQAIVRSPQSAEILIR